jgi:caffeoyl-CoA O-methyltransferase
MAIDLLPAYLQNYLDGLVPPRPPEMQAMEAYAKETNFPIIGPASGYFCYLITRLAGARRVYELGSGYGYSTAWFAKAVKENGGGTVYHTVWDAELSRQARRHLAALGYEDLIHYQVSEAVQALKETQGPFDVIFNDIDKPGYPASLPVIREKLRSGGILITDNLLFHGTVFEPENHTDSTQAIREYTRLLSTDPDWISSIVPVRDGVMISYKK